MVGCRRVRVWRVRRLFGWLRRRRLVLLKIEVSAASIWLALYEISSEVCGDCTRTLFAALSSLSPTLLKWPVGSSKALVTSFKLDLRGIV